MSIQKIKTFLKNQWIWLTVCAGIMVFTVAADQISKSIVAHNMTLGQSITLIPHVLNLSYTHNSGAAFGMMSSDGSRWIFMILSTVAIIGGSVYVVWKFDKLNKIVRISAAMLIGGGIGNMIDRSFAIYGGEGFLHGEVVDFIDFRGFGSLWTAVFNVADIAVTVGVALLMFSLIRDMIREFKEEKAKKATETATAEPVEPQGETFEPQAETNDSDDNEPSK